MTNVLKPIVAAGEAEATGARGEAEITLSGLKASSESEILTTELERTLELYRRYSDAIPPEVLLRAIVLSGRLTGMIVKQTPAESARLIQAVDEILARLSGD